MTGIYKYTNKINGHSYIGQSIDIEKRQKDHIQRAYRNTKSNHEYEKAFYRAIRKYGIENFTFEILKICPREELNMWEKYYISKYDSFHHGYNEDEGGSNFLYDKDGEKHPRHKLLEADVYYIREAYANHELKDDVYELYKNKIGHSGFNKIWNGATWTNVHMDVYTEENRAFHTLVRNSHPGKGNGRRLTIEQIKDIKSRAKNESLEEVFKDYKDIVNKQVFERVYYGITYTAIQ